MIEYEGKDWDGRGARDAFVRVELDEAEKPKFRGCEEAGHYEDTEDSLGPFCDDMDLISIVVI